MKVVGRHAIANLEKCEFGDIDNIDVIRDMAVDSVKEAGLNIKGVSFYKFEPIGISGIIAIQESHVTIHTWPEYKFVAIDAFTCGTKMNPRDICNIIAKKLKATNVKIEEMERGFEE